MAGIGVKLPLIPSETDGNWALNKSLKDTVKQNLKMLLLTNPGERMMEPLFGVGLRGYLFEQNLEATYNVITSEIRAQVNKYLPFLEISDIVFSDPTSYLDHDGSYVHISIHYRLLPLDIDDVLDFIEEVN